MRTPIVKRMLLPLAFWLGVVVMVTTLYWLKNLALTQIYWPEGDDAMYSNGWLLGQAWAMGLEAGFLSAFLVLGWLLWRKGKRTSQTEATVGNQSARKWIAVILAVGGLGVWALFVSPSLNHQWITTQFMISRQIPPADFEQTQQMFRLEPRSMNLFEQLSRLDSLKLNREKWETDPPNQGQNETPNESPFGGKHPGLLDSDSARLAAARRVQEAISPTSEQIDSVFTSVYDRQIQRLKAEMWKRWALMGWGLVLLMWGGALAASKIGRYGWLAVILCVVGGFLVEVILTFGVKWVAKEEWSVLAGFILPMIAAFLAGAIRWMKESEKSALRGNEG